jgi:hypothetical protein
MLGVNGGPRLRLRRLVLDIEVNVLGLVGNIRRNLSGF